MLKRTPLYVCLTAILLSPPAFAGWSADAAELLQDWLQGKASKSRAVATPISQDNWGGDARRTDPRDSDDAPRAARARRTAPAPESAEAQPERLARTPTRKAEARARDSAPAATGCVNVARTWDGLARLALQGEEKRAYDGYLRLLGSCSRDSELEGTASQARQNLSEASVRRLLDEPLMYAGELAGARYQLASQVFFLDNRRGNNAAALSAGRKLRDEAMTRKDGGLIQVLAWQEHNAGNTREAERLFRQAVRFDPDNDNARVGLATVLLARERPDAALSVVDKLDSEEGDRIKSTALAAQAQAALGKRQFEQAGTLAREALDLDEDNTIARIAQGWVQLKSGEIDLAEKSFSRAYADSNDGGGAMQGMVAVAMARNDQGSLERLAGVDGKEGEAARRALGSIYETQGRRVDAASLNGEKAETVSSVFVGAGIRSKSGDSGEERLHLAIDPAIGIVADTGNTRVQASVERLQAANGADTRNGSAIHLALSQRIDDAQVSATVDYTAFNASHTGGSIAYRQWHGQDFWSVGASRELVMESLRSMGADERSGVGPVSKTSLQLQTAMKLPAFDASWETSTRVGDFSGRGVSNNSFFEHDNAVLFDRSLKNLYFAAGPAIHLAAHARDENRFETGFGGYFSPESEFGFGLKARVATPAGRRWLLKGEGQALYINRSGFDTSTNTLALEGSVAGALLINPNLIGWGRFGTRSSTGYTDVSAFLGVSIPFGARSKVYDVDIPGFKIQ